MNEVFFCPVCGHITNAERLLLTHRENKCLYCGSALQGTGKDKKYYTEKAFSTYELGSKNFPQYADEMIRKEVYYDNPLFDKEKCELREQKQQRIAAQNRAGLNPLDNVPKCPACGSRNLSRLSGVGMITMFGGFGVTDGNAGKTFKCNNCGYRW